MYSLNQSPYELCLPQLTSASWKLKILFLETLSSQIANNQLPFPIQQVQTYWPTLIKEHNLNVLSKAINALQLWVNTFGIRSFKVQKQLIRTLISLSRMRKSEIDLTAISIVIALIMRQKQQQCSSSRVPLAVLNQSYFNSLNNPTFLVGHQGSADTMQEDQNQKQSQTTELLPASSVSILLAEVMDCMKGCQKYSFLLCLKILHSMTKDGLLTKEEFIEFQRQAEHIKEVIAHRKFTNNIKDKQIDCQIKRVLQQLKSIEL